MVDVVQVAATLAAMVVVIGGIAAAVAWLRKWITGLAATASRAERAATVAATRTSEQLKTSNGHTVGQYVEGIAAEVKTTGAEIRAVRADIGALTDLAGENQLTAKLAAERAERAEALARRTSERLDAHLLAHGGTGG